MDVEPVRVVPRLVERVWGRRDLSPWCADIPQSPGLAIGEAWLTDTGCEVEGGGTLGDLIGRDANWLLGDAAGRPPILAKMLFTAAPLSVQVHPTDAAARSTGTATSGKNEAWHILEADTDAAVWVGLLAPATPAQLRMAAADGSVMKLLRRHLVHPGNTVAVAAGTIHTIGAGLVLLEIQDPVDVTYRLYDFGRPRPLQVEEALSVANLHASQVQAQGDAAATATMGGCVLARAPRFVAERHEVGGGLAVQPDGARYHILVPLAPGVLLDGRELRPGAAALVPAHGRAAVLTGAERAPVAVLHPGPAPTSCLTKQPSG